MIAQAITEHQIESRGPGCLCSHATAPQVFRFYHGDESPWEECIDDTSFDLWPPHHQPLWGRDCKWQQRNPRPLLPQPPHLPLIEDLKTIGVWCQQLHWYHHSLTGPKAPSIPIMADVTGRLEAT